MANKCPGVYFHGLSSGGEVGVAAIGRHVQRPADIRERVSFEVVKEMGVPASELKYPPNLFDVVLFHNYLMHVDDADKGVLLQKASKLLRPGGKCLVINYCRGKPIEDSTKEFGTYLDNRGYTLLSPEEERQQLELYFQVDMFDLTSDFFRFLDTEMDRIEEQYGEPLAAGPSFTSFDMGALKSSTEQELVKSLTEVRTLKESQRKADHYAWCKKYWTLKQRSVIQGELKYMLYVATKKE
jgi:SAM-dependent methyltransferase